MRKEIKILIVENSGAVLKTILRQLDKDAIVYSYLNVDSRDDYIKALTDYIPDIILSDCSFPAIELLKDLSPGTPVIIVTSSNDENIVIECMKKGADDYIHLNNISRLVFAINMALENKKIRKDQELYEKKILKLNRTYAVIGQINEMIVRVRDKEKLFEEACKIAVETGKYRLVWIGVVADKNKIIRPHIWKGIDGGFLDEISKMPADYLLNNDPIQKSILKGDYFICNNILEVDSGFILRKNGLAHGFHSLISLPLTVRNKVLGSFNIYAAETDFFTEEELKLLVEVAGDISFSLEAIENEKAISVSEVKYRRLFESANEGIIIINVDNGEIVDINPFIINNLGYSKEELVGKQFWDIDFLKDSPFNRVSFRELLEYEYLGYEDLSLRRKDGTFMNVEFVSNVFWVDNKKVIQCNIHDISQRKNSEEALRTSEARLHTLLQNIPDLVWLKDEEGVYLSCNKMFERFFNASESEIVGKTDYDFVDREVADYYRNLDRVAITTGKYTSREESATFADDGHRAIMETVKTPVYDSQGTLVGVLGIAHDITERKRVEHIVQEREERFRAIFEQAPIAIALLDMQGYPIISNLPLSKMLGYSNEELTKMKFTDFTHPDDAGKDMDQYSDLIEGKISRYTMEKRYIHKNGNIVWANLIVTILRDDLGVAHEIIGMAEDITERKHAEEKLRESEERFRHSFDYAATGICIVGIDFKFQRVNNTLSQMLGYNEDELKNLTFSDITHPDDISIGIDNLKRMLAGEIDKASFEKRYIRKDNSIIWVYVSPSLIRDNDNKPQFIITQVIDITERKSMVEDLLKLSSAVEQSPVSILITDINGNIEYINPKLTETTGYMSEEVIGQNPRIFSSGENPLDVYKLLWDTISAGYEWQGEMHNKKKNGDLYWELVSISPIFNEKEEIAHYLAIKEDITERKRVEKELIEAKEKAESANKLKDAFIANISHEIRTPINGILGMTGLLKDSFQDFIKIEDEELFEGIHYSSQRLIRTVDLILNYSRLQVGEFPLFPKIIELSSICKNLIREFSVEAKNKSIEFTFQNNCEDSNISSDEYSIVMAISNLLGNAIKFSSNGFINIILHKNNNDEIILDVIDTGIGISEDYLDKIFEPYRQEQMGYGRAYDGVGLGLALVKKVLNLNGFTISVKSIKGEGAAFSINFGYRIKSNGNKIVPLKVLSIPPVNVKPENKVVLLVEDDLINQRTIIRFIESNYNTLVTSSSDGAMEILSNKKVDLILMDISILGDKNGLELTKDLKSSEEFSYIPVIAITAHAFEEDRQNALASGCDNYLAKPFSKQELLDIVNIYLQKPN